MKKKSEPFIITVIQDLANISALVNTHFQNNEKTTQWMNTENPLLDGKEPVEMIFSGRTEKLLEIINTNLKNNEL